MSSSELGAETTSRLNATPQAATATNPAFDVTANAQAFAIMAHVQGNLKYPFQEKPSPTIMTINEAGQVRATVVISGVVNGHQVMSTLFKGSLAVSDS